MKGRKLAREQGAHEVFDHRAPDQFEQIMKATVGRGVDVIVELLANANLGTDLTVAECGMRNEVRSQRSAIRNRVRLTMNRRKVGCLNRSGVTTTRTDS